MRGKPTKKTHHPHTGVRWPFSPERFSAAARGVLYTRNLAGTRNHGRCDRRQRHWLARLEKQGQMVRGPQL